MAKFTKEAVVEKIKNILKTTGGGQEISDRTINDATESLMTFANEEVELDAFVAQIQGGLISMNGNMRKEKADAAKVLSDAEAEKARLAKIEADRIKAEEESKKGGSDEPEWAKKIREKFEAQELKETESQKKATTEAKLKSATSLLEAAGCKSKKVLEVALSKIQVTDEMTDEQIKATVLPLYNTEYKEFYGDGQMPATAAGNVTPEVKKELRDNSNKLVDKALEKAGIKKPESK